MGWDFRDDLRVCPRIPPHAIAQFRHLRRKLVLIAPWIAALSIQNSFSSWLVFLSHWNYGKDGLTGKLLCCQREVSIFLARRDNSMLPWCLVRSVLQLPFTSTVAFTPADSNTVGTVQLMGDTTCQPYRRSNYPFDPYLSKGWVGKPWPRPTGSFQGHRNRFVSHNRAVNCRPQIAWSNPVVSVVADLAVRHIVGMQSHGRFLKKLDAVLASQLSKKCFDSYSRCCVACSCPVLTQLGHQNSLILRNCRAGSLQTIILNV